MRVFVIFSVLVISYVQGQNNSIQWKLFPNPLNERIGNFSVELLHYISLNRPIGENLIVAPMTVWTVLAVLAEGAENETLEQINFALRITKKDRAATRADYLQISQFLQAKTSTIELARDNAVYVDSNAYPEKDFQLSVQKYYNTRIVPLLFSDAEKTAKVINDDISKLTRGKIPQIVDSSSIGNTRLVLTSAVFFHGQWKSPFNKSLTQKMPFYNEWHMKIGEVNMMFNRYNYPFANIQQLQARVIELPYGVEDRLSMLIMVPNPGITLTDMFQNLKKSSLDLIFKELAEAQRDFGEDDVECFLPRFKIESNLELSNILQNNFGIEDLFDSTKATLPNLSRILVHASRFVHKAEIEVTEEGATAAGVTVADLSNRIGNVRFEANRPFAYIIVEKKTNSIVFGGLYKTPQLF